MIRKEAKLKEKKKIKVGECACNVHDGEMGLCCYGLAHFPSELSWSISCKFRNTDYVTEKCDYENECDFQEEIDMSHVREYPELFEESDVEEEDND